MNQVTLSETKQQLVSSTQAIESCLPAHIPVKKFMRTAMSSITNNPDIGQCQTNTVISACQKAAQDGLILDGREAALVSFNKKNGNQWEKHAQYMPMVNGILKKLRNSGQISTISAQVVYENDEFSYNPGTAELNHNPDWFSERGEPVGVYAIAELKDGGRQVEIMNKAQLDEVRKVSKSGSDRDTGEPAGIWKTWPQEMWKKTVLRRIAKYLPSSADLDQMWESDNNNFDFTETPDEPQKQNRASAEDLNSVIGGESGQNPSASQGQDEPIEGDLV